MFQTSVNPFAKFIRAPFCALMGTPTAAFFQGLLSEVERETEREAGRSAMGINVLEAY